MTNSIFVIPVKKPVDLSFTNFDRAKLHSAFNVHDSDLCLKTFNVTVYTQLHLVEFQIFHFPFSLNAYSGVLISLDIEKKRKIFFFLTSIHEEISNGCSSVCLIRICTHTIEENQIIELYPLNAEQSHSRCCILFA